MLLKGHGLDIGNRREGWTGKGYESYFQALAEQRISHSRPEFWMLD
jgi:hypothetical protein